MERNESKNDRIHKLSVIVAVVLAIMMGIERLWRVFTRKMNIDWKTLVNAGIVILFMVAGYLWGLTGFYDWISEMRGIKVVR